MDKGIKKFFIVDNVIIGANHVIGNAGYVNFVQSLYPGKSDLVFFGEKTHIDNIKPKVIHIPGNKISYEFIDVLMPDRGPVSKMLSWYKKIQQDKKKLISILERAVNEHVEMVLFCIMTPINLYLFNHIFKRYGQLKIAIVLHGELEYLFRKDISKMQKFKGGLFKKSFDKSPDNVKYFVVSEFIKNKLVEEKVFREGKISFIEHPINELTRSGNAGIKSPVKFSQIGIASKRKGSHLIFDTAKVFQPYVQNKDAVFQIIGKLYEDVIPYKNDFVTVLSRNNENIRQGDYEKEIFSSTYALSFITGDEYIYRVSGSVIDTIQYQLPIIALKHEFINHLFRVGGDIGFLCADMDELKKVIREILNKNPEYIDRYDSQVFNLKQLAFQYYNDNITKIFRNNLEKLEWKI